MCKLKVYLEYLMTLKVKEIVYGYIIKYERDDASLKKIIIKVENFMIYNQSFSLSLSHHI